MLTVCCHVHVQSGTQTLSERLSLNEDSHKQTSLIRNNIVIMLNVGTSNQHIACIYTVCPLHITEMGPVEASESRTTPILVSVLHILNLTLHLSW